MDLLEALRDVGVTNPATDQAGEARVRDGLIRELDRSRKSRRRAPRWVVAGSACAIATAIAAITVTLAVIPSSHPASRSVALGPKPQAEVRNAAYVIRHVKAKLISLERGFGVVTSTVDYVGFPVYHDVIYLDPKTGAIFQADKAETRSGRVLYENVDEDVPVHDEEHFRTFSIDYTRHSWSAGSGSNHMPIQSPSARPFRARFPGALSTPRAVEHALSSHLERRAATTTLDGVRALVLTGRDGIDHITLDVDASTYQPLRETEHGSSRYGDIDQITHVLAATPPNITLAVKRPKIPTGYAFIAP